MHYLDEIEKASEADFSKVGIEARAVLNLIGEIDSVGLPVPAVAKMHGKLLKRSDRGEGQFDIFVPFTKVEEQDDGTLIVEAWASVADFIDSDGEYFSPEGLRKFVESWAPFGNFRAQHDPKKPAGTIRQPALGKKLEAELGWWIQKHPETDTEGLFVRSRAVDSEAIKFIKAGVYTGLSVGGSIPPGGRKVVQVEVNDAGVVLRELGEAA